MGNTYTYAPSILRAIKWINARKAAKELRADNPVLSVRG